MRTVVIGCGNWGSRVALRLRGLEGVTLTAVIDDDHERAERVARDLGLGAAARDLPGLLSNMQPDAVVIATPPATHESVLGVVLAHGVKRVRVEKPLAVSSEQAQRMELDCAAADADLSVGFTLLHHPAYEAAFAIARSLIPVSVTGMRLGGHPRHDVSAGLDAGIHTASIAAHLWLPLERIVLGYTPHVHARQTTIHTVRGAVTIDELAGTTTTPYGIIKNDPVDALSLELAAWVRGEHRGTAPLAINAQYKLEHAKIELVTP